MKAVFGVGEVARICGTRPRTIQKMCDCGGLKCCCIPGSSHRRITGAALLRFMKQHSIPTWSLFPRVILLS